MRRNQLNPWIFGCLLAMLTAGSAVSQPPPLGGEFRVNTTTLNYQRDPQVAMDADGNFVVVWSDGDFTAPTQDGSSFGIIGQRYDSAGNPVGGEFVVNTDTLGAQTEPAVAMDADGDFVVVWTDTSSFGGDGDGSLDGIAGQRFESAGNPVGSEFQVNTVTYGQQFRANVAMSAAGDFVVAWGGPDTVGYGYDLFARRFNSAGSPVGGEFQVNTFAPYRQYNADIGFDDAGNFVIVWENQIDDIDDTDVYARRYDSAGNALTGEFRVNTTTTRSQIAPTVAVRSDGSFVVAWGSYDLAGDDGQYSGIAAQRYDSAGAAVGSEFLVNTYTTGSQGQPTLGMDARGRFTVAWTSRNQDGDDDGIFAQQFDSAGSKLGSEFQVNTYTTGKQGYSFRSPGLGMDQDGNFVVAWQDGYAFDPGQDGSGTGVYAQRFAGPPPTPEELIADLDAFVETLNLGGGLTNALTGKLDKTLARLAAGNVTGACNMLGAFENQISGLAGNQITAADAQVIFDALSPITSALGC